MENTEHKSDRTSWGRGPWDAEPEDRVDFVHAGFACFVKRGPLGVWCGYVGVPQGHPAYGYGYDDVPVEVHGGLTYADSCKGGICHVPQPGMPDDVWWLGFDCGHSWDEVPLTAAGSKFAMLEGLTALFEGVNERTYKTLAYAQDETRKLADQLHLLGD